MPLSFFTVLDFQPGIRTVHFQMALLPDGPCTSFDALWWLSGSAHNFILESVLCRSDMILKRKHIWTTRMSPSLASHLHTELQMLCEDKISVAQHCMEVTEKAKVWSTHSSGSGGLGAIEGQYSLWTWFKCRHSDLQQPRSRAKSVLASLYCVSVHQPLNNTKRRSQEKQGREAKFLSRSGSHHLMPTAEKRTDRKTDIKANSKWIWGLKVQSLREKKYFEI